ncbi:rtn4ip1 [Symbiodinium natans]|uniref:Rtn4ip1 protein n=1 Tax=Symbiodinium natans TaxID=878477 RepID=A0A812PDB6_9DINO|nr:rtn4ip1 [Symbiodinium natans]
MLRANEANVDLTRLREWVDQKLLRTEIAEVFSFEDAPKALETLEEGGGHNAKKTTLGEPRSLQAFQSLRLRV